MAVVPALSVQVEIDLAIREKPRTSEGKIFSELS